MNTIKYFLAFLDAYDFGTEDEEGLVKKSNRDLINASVLGLIFEKINGYKDGSFYTPGIITQYICEEVIDKVVVDKFNEKHNWKCTSLTDVYNKDYNPTEANELINSIHICDPAVGSGHFLVSALNRFLYVKAKLGLLYDNDGKRLKEYTVDLESDEIMVQDEEGEFVTYKRTDTGSQRVQETLFREKRIIIENCLFGVDINPKAVEICRLRLWIELLKNAYYKTDGSLETLPNIDINIKCGDSLLHRFAIDSSIKDVLKGTGIKISDYKEKVREYKQTSDKGKKKELTDTINKIKTSLKSEINKQGKEWKRKEKIEAELWSLQLALDEKSIKAKERKDTELRKELTKLEATIKDIESNVIYKNSFEWRIEFPELLDDDGTFVGFEAVIGNPPYVDSETMENHGLHDLRKVYQKEYSLRGNWDIYIAFFGIIFIF